MDKALVNPFLRSTPEFWDKKVVDVLFLTIRSLEYWNSENSVMDVDTMMGQTTERLCLHKGGVFKKFLQYLLDLLGLGFCLVADELRVVKELSYSVSPACFRHKYCL